MAGILFKVAKEFNVATSTVVEFLSSKGYSIENKPNAKVEDDMYALLELEFKGSAVIKEKADQIQIGSSFKKPEEKVIPKPEPFKIEKPVIEIPKVEIEKPKVEPIPEPIAEVKADPQPEDDVVRAKSNPIGLKVVGNIDLDRAKSKPKAEQVEPEQITPSQPESAKIETPAPKKEDKEEIKVEPKVEIAATPAPLEITTPPEESKPSNEPEEYRAKTPQLSGLKILGKIDTNRFAPQPKKGKKDEKKPEPAKPGTPATAKPAGSTPATDATTAENNKKRKRKRKKVQTVAINPNDVVNQQGQGQGQGTGQGQGQNRNKPFVKKPAEDEVKEVSQKEIDDKIKATMARMSGGGKNKRQKIRRDNRDQKREKQDLIDAEQDDKKLLLTEFVSVQELANLMDVGVGQVITTCMSLGVIVSINQRLDAEIIELVANEFGFEIEFVSAEAISEIEEDVPDPPESLRPRAPIVTVMGHVDHGKTSLLDFIRSANVAQGEAGGITQHVGAYEVEVGADKKKITFLDTPGHEAFTAMRARGAKVTDIAVIVVAADDRVMPQTKEAISHAQAAGVPIIFAINKIDKEGANPTKIKQELSEMNLLVEEWGGTIQSQDISAKAGMNIDLLLEKILLEAEIQELKANPERLSLGTVLEASLDKGRGYVTKVLIQTGTLRMGDPIVSGPHSGRVKAMFNEKGKKLKIAGPSTPVLVLGLSGAPQAGEKFKTAVNEQEARTVATKRSQIEREQANRASKRISLDEIGRRLALGNFKELNLIVKGDVDGSVEALADSLIKLSVESIQINVIHKAVGQIVESDVLLASASDAIIIGFQVRPSTMARQLAEREGVQIKSYSIIYEALDEIKMAMEGMLEPTKVEKILGQIDVRETFTMSKIGTIAGCFVTEGKVLRNNYIRLIRDGIVVFPTREGAHGEISSLKRYKEDVKEVKSGMECGITIKNYNDVKVNDVIEVYEIVETKTKLA
jgi:translation initiation factor IF-2